MTTRAPLLLAASLSLSACFAPDENLDADTDVSPSGGETGSGTSAPTTSEPTTGEPTTSEPTTDTPTTGEPTTGDPTDSSTTDDPTMDPTSGGEDPFCGDGNVDPGEECDDGVDNNALDGSCLPDCNLNVCGDSNLGPDEVCDDGEDDNILEVGACAPDCSRVIEAKVIQRSAGFGGGNLQPNPVGFADGQCEVGFSALFSLSGQRQATNGTPYTADAPMDWPLRPYTAYVTSNGELLWITDDQPLLGVRDGEAQPLLAPIVEPCEGKTCILFIRYMMTGLNDDWTTTNANTCNGWSSSLVSDNFSAGDETSVTDYLSDAPYECDVGTDDILIQPLAAFYCVEQ